jgi:hypothetical protein
MNKKTEGQQWLQSQSVDLEGKAHQRRPVVSNYRSGFAEDESHSTTHEEVRSEGHNVRWWESGYYQRIRANGCVPQQSRRYEDLLRSAGVP